MYFNARSYDVYYEIPIPHEGISFLYGSWILNRSDNGLIKEAKLVTWRFVNFVVHNGGLECI
jgi:hypothetical protein